jgi:hypothetical protein
MSTGARFWENNATRLTRLVTPTQASNRVSGGMEKPSFSSVFLPICGTSRESRTTQSQNLISQIKTPKSRQREGF